jgi:hypothetical protein
LLQQISEKSKPTIFRKVNPTVFRNGNQKPFEKMRIMNYNLGNIKGCLAASL